MKRDTGRPTSDSRLELSGSGFLPGSAGAGPPAAKTFSSAGDLLYLQDLSRFTARSHCAVRVGGLGALGRGRGAAVEEGSSHGEACPPAGPTCDLTGRSWEGTVTIRTAALRFQCLGVRSVRSSRSNSPVRPGAESVSREQGSAGPRQHRPARPPPSHADGRRFAITRTNARARRGLPAHRRQPGESLPHRLCPPLGPPCLSRPRGCVLRPGEEVGSTPSPRGQKQGEKEE